MKRVTPIADILTKLTLSVAIVVIVYLFVAPRTLVAPEVTDLSNNTEQAATTSLESAVASSSKENENDSGNLESHASPEPLPTNEILSPPSISPSPQSPTMVSETHVNLDDPAIQKLIAILRPTSTPSVTPPPIPVASVSFEAVNRTARESLVNILCLANQGSALGSISATGIMIDARGVVLTNAHIGQHFLLSHEPDALTDCTLRVGSPARNRYRAELLFLPELWIKEHPDNLREENPKGTGEHDFALLLITASTDPETSLPSSYPALTPQFAFSVEKGEQLLVAGYAAGFLGGISIQKDLYSVSSIATMNELFSYDGVTPEFLEISGNVAAQRGSSGGAVVNNESKLVGLVSTVSMGTTTDDRLLGAITPTHIDRSMRLHGLSPLETTLEGDVAAESAAFRKNKAPALEDILRKSVETGTPTP